MRKKGIQIIIVVFIGYLTYYGKMANPNNMIRFGKQRPDTAGLTAKHKVEEEIVDSLNIAERGKNKMILQQMRFSEDSVRYSFELYEKKNGSWNLIQKYQNTKDKISGLDPRMEDFNGDGYNDIAITTATAARSANEIRTLFIFKKETKRFTMIRNSENYPNLRYNAELRCVDAWIITAGCSTVFLKLTPADTLMEFAEVSVEDGIRTSYEIDKNGKMKVLKKEKVSEDHEFERYINYKPVKW